MTPRRLIEPARLAGAALLHTQTDERLVDLTRAGNDRAFEAVVARYRRPLLRYCRRLLPPERAEDAVQQTFLNAYRAIGAGEAELNLRPWLYRIAHNASMSLLRQNGWGHEQLDEGFDGVQQPPQAVEERERVREVIRAVRDLPPRQRDAIVLRELEGRSYEEIALALGVSGGAVRQLLNRARTTLRSAATAVTPAPLASWLAARGSSAAPAGERIAELCAAGGAGGFAAAGKLGAAVLVAGAVAGTTGAGPLPSVVGGGSGGDAAAAAEGGGADGPSERGPDGPGLLGERSGEEDEREGRGRGSGDDDESGSGSDGDSDSDDDTDRRGSGDGDDDSHDDGDDDDEDDSHDDGDDSGDHGDDGDGGGGSGSGSGSYSSGSGDGEDRVDGYDSGDASDDDHEGSGSYSSGSGSSGSGSSGSGSGSTPTSTPTSDDDGGGEGGSGSSDSD